MKKEYDFSKAKKRSDRIKIDTSDAKIPTSIRLDGSILAWFKTEAERQGIPYQTLISSVLRRFALTKRRREWSAFPKRSKIAG